MRQRSHRDDLAGCEWRIDLIARENIDEMTQCRNRFKIGYVAFSGAILFFVLAIVFLKDKFKIRKESLGLLILSFILFVPWIARGYITSGYPFFPSPWFGLRVDWKVPLKITKELETVIYSWARLPLKPPSQVLANYDWIPPGLRVTRSLFQLFVHSS